MATVQQAYSLVCRSFDSGGLAECCLEEGVRLLAYSPLAMGLLTHKYASASDERRAMPAPTHTSGAKDGTGNGNAKREATSSFRLHMYRGRYAEAEARYPLGRRRLQRAVASYARCAREMGMAPLELALRFVLSHASLGAAVVGATSTQQLDALVEAAAKGPLDAAALEAVDAIHADEPNPAP